MNEISPEQMAQIQAIKRRLLGAILSKEAYERLGRVKMANPMLAEQLELYLIQLYEAGKLKEIVTDEKLKEILSVLTTKKETKIIRK